MIGLFTFKNENIGISEKKNIQGLYKLCETSEWNVVKTVLAPSSTLRLQKALALTSWLHADGGAPNQHIEILKNLSATN